MKWVVAALGAVLVLVVLVAGGIAWLGHRAQVAADAQQATILQALTPVREALERGATPPEAVVASLAADPMTRLDLYDLLVEKQKEVLFPAARLSAASLGESALVVWLAHPNELGGRPDQIELVKEVTLGKETFCVFRFRMNTPHWAADQGWMAGITGPYAVGGASLRPPREGGAFSTIEPFGSLTPEQHVERARAEMGSVGVVKTRR